MRQQRDRIDAVSRIPNADSTTPLQTPARPFYRHLQDTQALDIQYTCPEMQRDLCPANMNGLDHDLECDCYNFCNGELVGCCRVEVFTNKKGTGYSFACQAECNNIGQDDEGGVFGCRKEDRTSTIPPPESTNDNTNDKPDSSREPKVCPIIKNSQYCAENMANIDMPEESCDCYNFCNGEFTNCCYFNPAFEEDSLCSAQCDNISADSQGLVVGCTDADRPSSTTSDGPDTDDVHDSDEDDYVTPQSITPAPYAEVKMESPTPSPVVVTPAPSQETPAPSAIENEDSDSLSDSPSISPSSVMVTATTSAPTVYVPTSAPSAIVAESTSTKPTSSQLVTTIAPSSFSSTDMPTGGLVPALDLSSAPTGRLILAPSRNDPARSTGQVRSSGHVASGYSMMHSFFGVALLFTSMVLLL
jgi:hypothetical protein